MKYRGYTIKLEGGRYKGYTPAGRYFCSADDKASIERFIREHRAKVPVELSDTEFERLVGLFPYPRGWTREHTLGAEARAALMANNTPAVARQWLRDEGLLDEQVNHIKEGPVNDAHDSETPAMEKVDAMIDFLDALREIGPHMDAIGQLCSVAVGLQRWGTSMQLAVHNLRRDEYDSFDGEDRLFPPNTNRSTPFWSKTVRLYDGNVDMDHTPTCEGKIELVLYTDEAPVGALG